MNSQDQWILEKFEQVNEKISNLQLEVKGLTIKMGVYTAVATFISTGIMAAIVKSIS